MWRAEDEALLHRLEDEAVLERSWSLSLAPHVAPSPPPRAAGMFHLVRRRSGGPEAIEAALAGRMGPLDALLAPRRLSGYSPALLHHFAIHHARLGRALAGASERAADAHVRSIAAWLALGEEASYLASLALAVVGSSMPPAEIDRAAKGAPFEAIDALGDEAKRGARERTASAAAALAALARIGEAATIASASEETTRAATRRSGRARAAAIEEALAPIREAIGAASARGDLRALGPELAFRMVAAWRWSGEDESVELAVVQELAPLAWDVYREGKWPLLRALIAPIEPLVDRLAQRIEGDPSRIAYAASCAQALVFRAELAAREDVEIDLLERALRVCPTHRNGRLVLANVLCDRAIRALDRARDSDLEAAAVDIERAEKTYPTSKRLDEAKKKLAAARTGRASTR